MATPKEMIETQHKTIQTLHRQMREKSNEFEIMRMQNYEYRTMIMRLLQVLETIDEAEFLPTYEYNQFVQSKVRDTLNEFGHASMFAKQSDPTPLEEVPDRDDV